MLEFLLGIATLKRIPRSGWLSHGISWIDVESVAEHTFSTAAISMMLTDLETKRGVTLDIGKVLRMAVLHDLAESLTFDISQAYLEYMGRRGREIKREVETNAWSHLTKNLSDPELRRKYRSVQAEYDANITRESRIVHAADSLEILLQILDYKRRGYPSKLLNDLWKERRKQVTKGGVSSAQKLLRIIVNQGKRMH